MLDGSHRTTAVTLTGHKIRAIIYEKDEDIIEAKKLVATGQVREDDILDHTLEENCKILNRHFREKPYFMTVEQKTQKMVNSVLNAFVDQDVELAQKILASDDEVDALNKDIHQSLLTVMQTDSKLIPSAIMLLLISRHLERMADHATNIAEQVIYMVKGQDIRHAGKSTNSLS